MKEMRHYYSEKLKKQVWLLPPILLWLIYLMKVVYRHTNNYLLTLSIPLVIFFLMDTFEEYGKTKKEYELSKK